MTSSAAVPIRAVASGALLAALGLSPARAHDFWIEPSSFRPPVPSELAVALRVGQNFRGDPVPRNDRLIQRFVLFGPEGERPIGGLPAVEPAGIVELRQPGLYVIGYRSGRTPVTLEAEKFEKYLAEQGLERIHALRAQRGQSARAGVEVFSRCAKAILVAGEGGPRAGFDRALGFTLELVPEGSPQKAKEFPVRLLLEGKPLEGALVVAMNHDEPEKKVSARTARDGQVRFRLPRSGRWLVKAVHMVPAPSETGADWESLWASLTFQVP